MTVERKITSRHGVDNHRYLYLARGQGHQALLLQTGFPDCSSSNVTATAAFAERRTLCPSTSATSPRSMKCACPLCWPSPLSRFLSLMRPLATPSTVPTWTPSAPITSMFWAILSVVIWSLLCRLLDAAEHCRTLAFVATRGGGLRRLRCKKLLGR